MNDYLERKLKSRDYFDKPTTTVFEKTPFVKCYNIEGSSPDEVFVTFKLGAIAKHNDGDYNIIYAEEASDDCAFFGAQHPDRTKYVFEIDGHRCKNVPELLEYAKSLEGAQFNLVQDEVEFMDI